MRLGLWWRRLWDEDKWNPEGSPWSMKVARYHVKGVKTIDDLFYPLTLIFQTKVVFVAVACFEGFGVFEVAYRVTFYLLEVVLVILCLFLVLRILSLLIITSL